MNVLISGGWGGENKTGIISPRVDSGNGVVIQAEKTCGFGRTGEDYQPTHHAECSGVGD